jgi:parallel beta-helix repeat protein
VVSALGIGIWAASLAPALAAELQVDPASLEDALSMAVEGDTLVLADGQYGELNISGRQGPLTLEAAEGSAAEFDQITVRNATDLTLRGLIVSGEATDYLIDLAGDNDGVTVEDCYLESAADTSSWSAQDWIDRASSGISVGGTNITIARNVLRNVGYGISVGADHSLVEDNLVENFSRDGLRGLGDYTVFQYNTVKNAYAVDDHHDDGFQSWSVGEDGVGTGEVTGIVLRGNTIINFEDSNQPHAGALQGIGCFDGTFVDWIVENNVVITNHWHGITLLGARGCIVRNNTVIDLNDESPGPPWVSVDDHKDGTPPEDCVVANNLTTDLSNAESVTETGNIVLSMDARNDYFVDAESFDLHLLESSTAVDAADESQRPELDRDRIERPQGDAHDVGAYEWHGDSVTVDPTADATAGTSDGSDGSDGVSDSGSSLADSEDSKSASSDRDVTGDSEPSRDGDAGATNAASSDDGSGCECRVGRDPRPAGSPNGSRVAMLLLGCALVLRQGVRHERAAIK